MVRKIILAGVVVLFPIGVQAQGRGMAMPVSRGMSVAPRMVAQVPHAGTAQAMPAPHVTVRSGAPRPRAGMPIVRSTRKGSTRSRFEDENINSRPGCNSAPGFGFDAVHQAAVCGSTVVGSRSRGFQLFFPFFDGGFFLPGSATGVEEGSSAETPQPEAIDSEVRERGRRYRVAEPETAPPVEAASAGPADNDEFVFVRRDGTVFFAVAYSWEKGTLRYITSQGLRRIVTQDALDLDATRQFNEQRGLNFRLPV
jgi:hypothetical protein